MPRARRSFVSSIHCIVDVVLATTETWKYLAPIQKRTWSSKAFEYGTWGGEIRQEFAPQPGEIVIQEHWCSSGFANTDWICNSRDMASINL